MTARHRPAAGATAVLLVGTALLTSTPMRPVAAQTGGAIPRVAALARDSTAGEPLDPVHALEIESVGAPRLAPDGTRILFTRARADWRADRQVSHIWSVRIDGTDLRQMTNGPSSEREPRWSPDGRRFAFLASRKQGQEEAPAQLWVMPLDGGEARQITHRSTAIAAPVWSADGSSIFFLAEEEPTPQERQLKRDAGGAHRFPREWKQRHLFRVHVDTGEQEQLTEGEFSVWAFDLSADGSTVALTRGPTPLLDDIAAVEVYLYELESRRFRRLTDDDVPQTDPALSPDGSRVAYLADALPTRAGLDFYYESNLFVAPADGGAARVLLPAMRGDVEAFAWRDSDTLVAQINLGVHSELFRIDLAGDAAEATQLTGWNEQLPTGSIEGFHLVRGFGLAYRRGAPDDPGDLWYAVSEPFDARRVTDLHDALRERWALPRAEVIRWRSSDGAEIEGILWYPIPYEEGTRYPLVVQIHGGPASSVQLTLPASWGSYVPVWASLGYFVLQPNYRGGVGYGDAFLRDMVGGYFRHADDDVYRGVDALVERGLVDADRTAIMGWSAGGHMTNWVVTQTDRFAAASSGAGAANWTSMYAQSDVRVYRTPWFGGTPWQAAAPLAAYLENSPVFYAHQAKTPTLILVGEEDRRVPMAQSIEMYRALHHAGVETELVVFPGEPHGLQRLRHRLHKINVELAWIERHVRGAEWRFAKPPSEEESGEGVS